MKLTRVLTLWTLWAWLAVAAPAQTTTLPASAPDTMPVATMPQEPASAAATEPTSQVTSDAEATKKAAFAALLKGDFKAGLDLLGQVEQPDDAVAQAKALTEKYLSARDQADEERDSDLQAAERRVRLAGLVQSYQEQLTKDGLSDKLFHSVELLADDFVAADRLLSNNSTSQPAEIRESALSHVDKAGEKLKDLQAAGAENLGDWSEAFKDTCKDLQQSMAAYRQAWEHAELPRDWSRVMRASEKVQDGLIDLSVLVSKDPTALALTHARQAKEVFNNTPAFLQQPWVKDVIAQAEKRGQELLKQGKWMDAMFIYGHAGLTDLDHDNTDYQEILKKINQHVRVISLYGEPPKPASGPASGPASAPAATSKPAPVTGEEGVEEEDGNADMPRWREMITGVDAKMILSAISQINNAYVENPNYRKMTLTALKALKVLAETPEAGYSFPSLKDDTKRQAFIDGVQKQIDQINEKEAVDQLDLAQSLNRMLDLNYQSLRLPPEVIDMEFAEGMCSELDLFSSMVWPYEEDDFQKRTMGSFYGIGVQITKELGKAVEVVTPLPDTPAFRAGMLAGDFILTVDGTDTKMLPVDKVVKMITGPRHTKVTLLIQRAGMVKPFDVTVERDEIHMETVKGWRRLSDGKWDYMIDPEHKIGYIDLSQFTQDSTDEMKQALRTLRQQGAKGLILDLRFNPGGLLTTAVEIADDFIKQGLIVRTKGRNVAEEE